MRNQWCISTAQETKWMVLLTRWSEKIHEASPDLWTCQFFTLSSLFLLFTPIPLQPVEKTTVKQVVPLQPMEDYGGADIHLQPVKDPTPEQMEMP